MKGAVERRRLSAGDGTAEGSPAADVVLGGAADGGEVAGASGAAEGAAGRIEGDEAAERGREFRPAPRGGTGKAEGEPREDPAASVPRPIARSRGARPSAPDWLSRKLA